jgi:hypothetical protein
MPVDLRLAHFLGYNLPKAEAMGHDYHFSISVYGLSSSQLPELKFSEPSFIPPSSPWYSFNKNFKVSFTESLLLVHVNPLLLSSLRLCTRLFILT